jgi:nucleoside-diphosphate-sugar epimerase
MNEDRSATPNPLAQDLDHILAHTEGLWDELRGQRIFITGGTGFFGCWLLESFTWANDKLGLGASATVLTRNPEAFRKKAPHLAGHPSVRLHAGEIRSFEFPAGEYSHIIHAATESSTRLNEVDPLQMLDTIIQGTRRTLDFAVAAATRKLLMTSSGTVYGEQPSDLSHIPETYLGAPDTMDARSAYGEGKRVAELLCAIYNQKHGIDVKIARCFAFVGPYLPLDAHFAIGNFIRDAIASRPIRIKGDGTPHRSYLYAADLTVWLWEILMNGDPCRPYNVGAGDSLTLAEVASRVAAASNPRVTVEIAKHPKPGEQVLRYVPSIERATQELKLRASIPLETAIRRTQAWCSYHTSR